MVREMEEGSVLILSSSLLTDRMLLYSTFLPELLRHVPVTVWATSARSEAQRHAWERCEAVVESFPAVRAFREFPYNYLRRLNEFAWDFRQRPPSRLSMMRHVRDKTQSALVRSLKAPARMVALLRLEQHLEQRLEHLMLRYPRSAEAVQRPSAARPHSWSPPGRIASTSGRGRHGAAARHPDAGPDHSWDNLYQGPYGLPVGSGYLVWSEQMRQELHHFYPASRRVPAYVVGAPQFDVFHQERFWQSREEFCAGQGLRPDRPIILHALGSPNFLREHHAARYLGERVARGDLGEVQLVIRPHPLFDNGEEADQLRRLGPRVFVQRTGNAGLARTARTQNERQITEWVNTFRHSDVVVNLSSTVTVDAAFFDHPVVNLDFDPEPGQPQQALVKDVNHRWTHFQPIAEWGGVWLVQIEEMVEAVRTT